MMQQKSQETDKISPMFYKITANAPTRPAAPPAGNALTKYISKKAINVLFCPNIFEATIDKFIEWSKPFKMNIDEKWTFDGKFTQFSVAQGCFY